MRHQAAMWLGMLAIVALGATTETIQADVRYVDDNAPTGGDGQDWTTAYGDLQEALTEAAGDRTITEIHVAGGAYVPSARSVPGSPRTATFQLLGGLALYGGYAGLADPNNPDRRDVALYETILSGDLNGDDGPDFANNDDNAYNVIRAPWANSSGVLDGFTVTLGNADGSSSSARSGGGVFNYGSTLTVANCTFRANAADSFGGGMYNGGSSNATVINCTFEGNIARRGGGVYNGGASPMVSNCTFTGNLAGYGGGMYTRWGGSPTVTDCTFSGNTAWYYGGAMYNSEAHPSLVNCIFARNSASSKGGAICNEDSSPTVTNCTFSRNSAPRGGGMYGFYSSRPTVTHCTFNTNSAKHGGGMYNSDHSTATITNTILWGNSPDEILNSPDSIPTVTYSCIRGGWPGEGNISTDPLFADADGPDDVPGTEDDDLHLSPGSPCINAGNNEAIPPDVTTDFEGDDRIQHCRVDMGADESPYFTDCNENGLADTCEFGNLEDCNDNGVRDLCDIADGTSPDCNDNATPDECEPDSDGDNTTDECDACPNSDLADLLIINGCETGVANHRRDDGCTLGDLIDNCARTAGNHGLFVSCVGRVAANQRRAGVITGRQYSRIMSCAAGGKANAIDRPIRKPQTEPRP